MDCTTVTATVLDTLLREVEKHDLERKGKRRLRRGKARNDEIRRAPPRLMPQLFASLNDHDTDMAADGQPKFEQELDRAPLFQSTDSGYGVPESGDEKSANKAGLAALMQQHWSSSSARKSQSKSSPFGTWGVDGG
jgi:hypothetical protein